jgi:beta-barrel assembly-enhancing protease
LALFFDGKSASAKQAELSIDGSNLLASFTDGTSLSWAYSDLDISKVSDHQVSIHLPEGEFSLTRDEWDALAFKSPALKKKPVFANSAKLAFLYLSAIVGLTVGLFLLVRLGAGPISQRLTIEKEAELFGSLSELEKTVPSKNLESLFKDLKPPSAVRARLVRREEVNAYTLPGASILVTTALVCFAQTPDEVSGIIAHEIGHVRERHILRSFIANIGLEVVASFITGGGMNSSMLKFLALNQSSIADEREADRAAADELLSAGLNPQALADFFVRMEKVNGTHPKLLTVFLSDHPHDSDRIAYFEERAQAFGGGPVDVRTKKMRDARWRALRAEAKCDDHSS